MAIHQRNKATTTTWEIDESGDTWILGEDGSITGDIVNGIATVGSIDAATVIINGEIHLADPVGTTAGLYLETQKATVSISATGRISGAGTAILYDDGTGSCSIDNDGLLRGFDGVNSWAYRNSTEIRNDGTIRATNTGIIVGGAGAVIVNSGVIRGEQGIDVTNGENDPLFDPLDAKNATDIVNTGRISGSDYALWAGGVAVNIRNRGTLNGDVLMGEGNDVFNTLGGTFNGVLYGGGGDDRVTLASPATLYVELADQGSDTVRINATYRLGANVENLTLVGKASHTGIGNSLGNTIFGNNGGNALYGLYGNDAIRGSNGSDRLDGGNGIDLLDGGKGSDILIGGADVDNFQFQPGYGRDIILDFEIGTDNIHIFDFGDRFGNDAADFADLVDIMSQPGDDTILRFSDKDVLILRNVNMGDLTWGDFAVHP